MNEPEIVTKARAIVADYKELQARPKGLFRGQRTEELDMAEAVVEFYEQLQISMDSELERILAAPDDRIQALLRQEGRDPKDAATIAKQAGEIAMLTVDLREARDTRPEAVMPVQDAAVAFRDSLLPRADSLAHGLYPLWHGLHLVESHR